MIQRLFSVNKKFISHSVNLVLAVLLFIVGQQNLLAETGEGKLPAWQDLGDHVNIATTYLPAETSHADPDERNGMTVTLADMGFKRGITLQGVETIHEVKLDYTIPSDTEIEKASIYLRFKTSPLLNDLANVQVSVEDTPLTQVLIGTYGEDHSILADIPLRFLKKGNVRIVIKAALPISEDRCLDTRVNGSILHIEPESSFTLNYTGRIASLRDAWTLLPNKVSISIPDRPFETFEYHAAWEIMDNLHRQGKEIEIVTFPEMGHIVIANRPELETQIRNELKSEEHADAATFTVDPKMENSTLSLVHTPTRSLIAINQPAEPSTFQMMNDPWQKLGVESSYKTYPVEYASNLSGLGKVPPVENAMEILLKDLNADLDTRYVRAQTQWDVLLDPFRLPPGTRPARLFLDLVAPTPPEKPPFELYVYLNDIMVHAQRLDSNNILQQLSITLPYEYQQPYNQLQIRVMNTDPSGDCRADLTAFPVQLLPESTLIVERDQELPENFADLPTFLADEFDLFIPVTFLENPAKSLPFLTEFTSRYPIPFKNRDATFLEAGAAIDPTRPFIAIGDVVFDNLDAPVNFDQGNVHITDRDGASLFKVEELPGITIAQLVSSNKQRGLWLRSGDSNAYPDIHDLFLNDDDIAFADHTGLLFSMNSKQPSLAKVHYPEARDWFAILGKYRFWLFVLGWLALTLLVIYLFKRTREHRGTHGSI